MTNKPKNQIRNKRMVSALLNTVAYDILQQVKKTSNSFNFSKWLSNKIIESFSDERSVLNSNIKSLAYEKKDIENRLNIFINLLDELDGKRKW